MWKQIIIVWLGLLAVLIAELWYRGTTELVYVPFMAIALLYALFNFSIVLFYGKRDYYKGLKTVKVGNPHFPKVAVFYTTYNDFNEKAFKSLLNLSYPRLELLILDDSIDENVRKTVDTFVKKYSIKVIRRKNRKGFKAGAINNALKYTDAEYIVIVDADEILPRNFVEETLKYFADDKVAFVQANHYAYNKHSFWERAMGCGVDLHWSLYQDYRNKYGMVNFLGHGAIIRTEALKEVGGFPEIVSEDIALTIELYNRGYRGVFAKDVLCGEEVPYSYHVFRHRHKKWGMGSIEFLRRYFLKMIRIRVPWWQKLDIILPVISLPMCLLLVVFSILSRLHPLSFTVVGLLSIFLIWFVPSLMFLLYLRNESIFMRFIISLVNAVAYMSLFAVSITYTCKGLIKAYFLVTPKRSGKKSKVTRYFFDYLTDVVIAIIILLISPYNILGYTSLLTPFLAVVFRKKN